MFGNIPDTSHKDQTSRVVRYVMIENQEVRVEESFIDFIETKNKTEEGIIDMILSKFKADGLDIMNCKGQAYNNAATMAVFAVAHQRTRKKPIFGDGSKDAQLSYEDDLRRTMFFSIDRVTAEIPKRFQHLQNIAQKYAVLRPEVILSMGELNLDQVPPDINKEV
ncbi:uncharacterized protein TNCV_386891 [Trichonephila clavipes]|nr:uncharacterized protein TNCV_386891 [Trichonephila clavipes]